MSHVVLETKLAELGNTQTCPCIILVKADKILLGLRNYTPDKWKQISVWTTPGGRCDEGETIEQTLRREVQEEVGITKFEVVDFIGVVPGAKEGDIVPLFYGRTNDEPTLMEPEKFSEWRWIPMKEYFAGSPYSDMNPIAHQMIAAFLQKVQ